MNEKMKTSVGVIVAGSFHTDFYDGVYRNLNDINRFNLVLIKIVNTKELSPEQKNELKTGHAEYKSYADYIFLQNMM